MPTRQTVIEHFLYILGSLLRGSTRIIAGVFGWQFLHRGLLGAGWLIFDKLAFPIRHQLFAISNQGYLGAMRCHPFFLVGGCLQLSLILKGNLRTSLAALRARVSAEGAFVRSLPSYHFSLLLVLEVVPAALQFVDISVDALLGEPFELCISQLPYEHFRWT